MFSQLQRHQRPSLCPRAHRRVDELNGGRAGGFPLSGLAHTFDSNSDQPLLLIGRFVMPAAAVLFEIAELANKRPDWRTS